MRFEKIERRIRGCVFEGCEERWRWWKINAAKPQKPRRKGSKIGTEVQGAMVPATVMGRRKAVDDTRKRIAPM